jgi:hypothetical protein
VLAPDVSSLYQRVLALSQDFPHFSVHVKGEQEEEDEKEEEPSALVHEWQAAATSAGTGTPVQAASQKEQQFLLRFDGGSRGNPGPAGAGLVIYEMDGAIAKEVYAGCVWMGTSSTNNEAEYRGLIEGLAVAKQMGIEVRGWLLCGERRTAKRL